MKTTSSARWEGKLTSGNGYLSTTSRALEDTPYTFKSRFEGDDDTNPEELLGAAHAGCFSMALSMILEEAGFTAERIETNATVELKEQQGGFSITGIHLEVQASVPQASAEEFAEAAGKAKNGCPVSKVLNAEITMQATLI